VNDFEQVKTVDPLWHALPQLRRFAGGVCHLTGVYDREDAGFAAFVDRAIAADIQQAIGRLRAHRRTEEQLEIILLSNFVLSLPTRQVLSTDITPEAASKQERLVLLGSGGDQAVAGAG
jgi:hypothetical protein